MTQVDTLYQLDTARNHPQNASAFRGARYRGMTTLGLGQRRYDDKTARYGGMTIQAVCGVNDSPFHGAGLYPPCPMFLCVYKKQLCEFAICGKITENQERIKCRCLTNLR